MQSAASPVIVKCNVDWKARFMRRTKGLTQQGTIYIYIYTVARCVEEDRQDVLATVQKVLGRLEAARRIFEPRGESSC